MNAVQQTKKTPFARSAIIGLAVVAVTGLVGGYAMGASNLLTPSVNAESDSQQLLKHHNSDGQVAYVIDAGEAYMAANGMDSNLMQVTDVKVQGDFAHGSFDGGDSGAHFFAYKADKRWQVVYAGQDITPEAKQMLQDKSFPQDWLKE